MFEVIIPSARATNLIPCVRALLTQEPELPPARVIVIDDGARAEAEAALPGICWIEGAKPFNFARNVNRGLAVATGDVFLLNDDALLVTPRGFSRLAAIMTHDVGLCSAGIEGIVGNPGQHVRSGEQLRDEAANLAFVSVFLPARTRALVGTLDERFSGYGFEDDDYSLRVRAAGLRLTIFDGCVVRHDGELPSSFRVRRDYAALFAQNRRLFDSKWQGMPLLPTSAWRVRITFPRSTLSAEALESPAFWYLVLHDPDGGEIARLDANAAELRALLSEQSEEIVLDRTVRSTAPPSAWTIWPVDRRRRWLDRISGTIAPEACRPLPS